MDYVIQTPEGEMLSKYGGFTNVANADVRRYNIDLAMEAIDRGVDEILWDYVRRPEGDIDGMVFPGLQVPAGGDDGAEKRAVNDAVVSFMAEVGDQLREDRKSALHAQSVTGSADPGGRRSITKNKNNKQ